MNPADVAKLTVPKLKAELAERGLDDTGLKKVLVDRLTAALAEPAAAAAPAAAPPSPAKAAAPAKRAREEAAAPAAAPAETAGLPMQLHVQHGRPRRSLARTTAAW